MKNLNSKCVASVTITLLLGVVIGSIGTHMWDIFQEKRVANNFISVTGKLYETDSQMLQTYKRAYDIMGACAISNSVACNFNEIEQVFGQSSSELKNLTVERTNETKKIGLYKSQLQ